MRNHTAEPLQARIQSKQWFKNAVPILQEMQRVYIMRINWLEQIRKIICLFWELYRTHTYILCSYWLLKQVSCMITAMLKRLKIKTFQSGLSSNDGFLQISTQSFKISSHTPKEIRTCGVGLAFDIATLHLGVILCKWVFSSAGLAGTSWGMRGLGTISTHTGNIRG
jgi:hypothetical protein